MRELDESEAIGRIVRTGGVVQSKQIKHPRPGLRVLAAIDFLVNHRGYYFNPLIKDLKERKQN